MDDRKGDRGEDGRAVLLENNANNFSPALTRRFRRYERRGLLWGVSSLERVQKCGRVRYDGQGVALRQTAGGVVGYAGVCTCGSVWACPVCNAKVMVRRALEIGGAVAAWQAEGGHCGFLTFTMRHEQGQALVDLWQSLSKAWHAVTAGKQWLLDRERYGIVGWLRVVEVTYGGNGWHVHVHALLFLDRSPAGEVLENLQARMFGRWSRALVRRGLASPLMAGQEAHVVTGAADEHLAQYFTKAIDGAHRIGLELTQSQSKTTRTVHSTASTWSLLDLVEETGELDLWEEWEQGSKGKRQLTWSQGLRERLGLRREESDEEIAAEEVGTRDDDLVLITANGWANLCRVPGDLGRLLNVAETEGLPGVRRFLDERTIEYDQLAEG